MARVVELPVPAAVEAERVLLGAILNDADQLLTVTDILPPVEGSWFYEEANRLIFDAILTLHERHDPIDLITVTDVLARRGLLDKVGGSVYLAGLTELFSSTANIPYYARLIRQKSLYRGLINLGTNISAAAYSQDDLPELIHQSQHTLMQLSTAQSPAVFATLRDLLDETIRQAQHADARDLTGVHTGLHGLNTITCGFQNAHLIILAARPSMGKSALALQFALAAAQSLQGLPVAVFSLEMSREEISLRILCSEARIDSQRLRRGFLARDEWGPIYEASARLENLPVLIDDTSSLSVMDIRTRAKRLQMERGLGMIIIDYLQLLSSTGRRKENRQQEVSEISRELKILAKDLNIPVIALSQLSREVEHKSPPVPVLSDLRDSGAIEQDADLVLCIYRGDIFEPLTDKGAQLLVLKQRNGPTGVVRLVFNNMFARFDERAERHQERLALLQGSGERALRAPQQRVL
jgi:replicative DNA helicase